MLAVEVVGVRVEGKRLLLQYAVLIVDYFVCIVVEFIQLAIQIFDFLHVVIVLLAGKRGLVRTAFFPNEMSLRLSQAVVQVIIIELLAGLGLSRGFLLVI